MVGAGIQYFAKFRAQMFQADLGNPRPELCALPQGKCPYCGLLKPEVKILERNATSLTVYYGTLAIRWQRRPRIWQSAALIAMNPDPVPNPFPDPFPDAVPNPFPDPFQRFILPGYTHTYLNQTCD
jgi:hypothetical protein